jgi:hypothetical protein
MVFIHRRPFYMTEQNIATLREAIEIDMRELNEKPLSEDQRRAIKDHLDTLISDLQRLLKNSTDEIPR